MEVGVQFLMGVDFLPVFCSARKYSCWKTKNNAVFANIFFQQLPGMMKTVPQMDIRLQICGRKNGTQILSSGYNPLITFIIAHYGHCILICLSG